MTAKLCVRQCVCVCVCVCVCNEEFALFAISERVVVRTPNFLSSAGEAELALQLAARMRTTRELRIENNPQHNSFSGDF